MSRGGGLLLAGAAFTGYSVVVEPNFMLGVTPYRVSPADWPADLNLRIAPSPICTPASPGCRPRESLGSPMSPMRWRPI